MKILRISWQNFKGVPNGEINCAGHDVLISGRNGAGKSSIASMLPFVLFGKIAAKGFDERGIAINAQTPSVTVEFDTVTLKRTVTQRNQNRNFINGEEVSATKFAAYVENLTKGAGTLLFNPFEFPNQHWKTQRDFLLKHFGAGDLPESTSTLTDKMKALRKEAAGIPYRVEEIERQLQNLPTGDVTELEKTLLEKTDEFAQKSTARSQAETLRRQLEAAQNNRLALLKKFHETKTVCPTCGAPLPKEKVSATREQIVAEGKAAADEIEVLQRELESLPTDVDEAQLKALQKEIRDLNGQIAALQNVGNLRERLKQLVDREKELNAQIAELEGQIAAADMERRKQMAASEESVNAQFEHVKFKLFKVMASGDIKEDCAAMINGVPFQALSKGEKFKAALDILKALQKKFGVEFPLFLDDAESYTSNSFVELPNQLFLFKVSETDLMVAIDEGRRAA